MFRNKNLIATKWKHTMNIKRNCDPYDENVDPIFNATHWILSRYPVAICDRFSVALVMWSKDSSEYSKSYPDQISDDASASLLEYSVFRLYNKLERFEDGGRDIAGYKE